MAQPANHLLASLPPEWPEAGLEDRVREAVRASGRKIVALDDDPTGVQTVHDIPVLAGWDVDALAEELAGPSSTVFLLTNSRSLPEPEAAALNCEIVANLMVASERTGVPFVIASRSDSTLRGHYPAETDAIALGLGGVDGVLICPAFFEGGRYTIDDVHYLRSGDDLVPVTETEFARDSTFGFRNSNLRNWVEEKTDGQVRADHVASISIEAIREGGSERVAALLMAVEGGWPVVVNAASYADLWVVALGLIEAEAHGKRFVYRTGASFVRARAGIASRPLLARSELLGPNAPPYTPGMVIVGSHTERAAEQLEHLLRLPEIVPIEVPVQEIMAGEHVRARLIREASSAAEAALGVGKTPVISTSRALQLAPDGDQLALSRLVSESLVEIVGGVARRPAFVVAKGGITSSDIGTRALGARRALVLGQIRPGIPVWRLGPEARYPELPYVIFPGNVGAPETLAEIVNELRSR